MNQELIDALMTARLLRSTEEVEAFDQALAGLADRQEESDLPRLFRIFTDSTEDPSNVMWGLIHLVERYDDEAYAREFVAALPETLSGAGEWMRILTMRQLNSDLARELLVRHALRGPSEAREALVAVLREIATYPQGVGDRADEVLASLGAT